MPERVALPLAVLWLCSLQACQACSSDHARLGLLSVDHDRSSVHQGESALDARRRDRPRVSSTRKPAPPRQQLEAATQVYYALAKHVEAAELRVDDTQVFHFGVPGDAKYTLAGWLSYAGEAHSFDGRWARHVRGRGMRIALPADRASDSALSLELRSFAAASLNVHLNGKLIATRPLHGKGFETLTLTLPSGVLRAGENALELHVTSASIQGFALAQIALTAQAPLADAAPLPQPSDLGVPGEPERLRVPANATLGYTLELPESAQLTAQVSAEGEASMSVTLVRDGRAPEVIATLAVDASPKPLRLDLRAFAHDVVRLDLAAQGAAVRLQAPAVMVDQPSAPVAAVSGGAKKPTRNVLLYLIDTLRADKLSAYNPNTRVSTPGLTRFVDSAAVMLRARTQENWTKPSVATLLSSLFPWQHHAVTDSAVVDGGVTLLPELLRERGFFTGAFIANGYVSDKFGFNQGFCTYRNYVREGRRSVAQAVAGDVLGWLDARPKDQPFFLYVHTIDPHVPYKPPKDFLARYDNAPYTGPVDFSHNVELLEHIKLGRIALGPRDKERLAALYDGEISYHDVHFNAIMRGLEQRGLQDDTLVIVTADHGEEFWDHGSVGHGHSVYDELLHIPMLVRLPSVTDTPRTVPSDVGLVDVAPTIMEALGQTPPASMAGRSFLPELLGETSDAPRATVSGFMSGFRTAAIGSWKLSSRTLDHLSLYDTSHDPGETHDLAVERPLTLRYLRAALGLSLSHSSATHAAPVQYASPTTVIDKDTEAQLRSLGYVGSARH